MFVRMVIVVAAVTAVAVAVPQFAPDLFPARSAVAPHQEASVRPPRPAARPAPQRSSVPKAARRTTIEADPGGHFYVRATIGGRPVDLMVDTGATSVAINEATARRLGIRPRLADYSLPISTANGIIRAAPVILRSVSVDGIRVRDVQAVVVRGEVLPVNLLGMSFLGRLSRFEIAGDRLVLAR